MYMKDISESKELQSSFLLYSSTTTMSASSKRLGQRGSSAGGCLVPLKMSSVVNSFPLEGKGMKWALPASLFFLRAQFFNHMCAQILLEWNFLVHLA